MLPFLSNEKVQKCQTISKTSSTMPGTISSNPTCSSSNKLLIQIRIMTSHLLALNSPKAAQQTTQTWTTATHSPTPVQAPLTCLPQQLNSVQTVWLVVAQSSHPLMTLASTHQLSARSRRLRRTSRGWTQRSRLPLKLPPSKANQQASLPTLACSVKSKMSSCSSTTRNIQRVQLKSSIGCTLSLKKLTMLKC